MCPENFLGIHPKNLMEIRPEIIALLLTVIPSDIFFLNSTKDLPKSDSKMFLKNSFCDSLKKISGISPDISQDVHSKVLPKIYTVIS